jgi:hypothetical protein
MCPQSQRSATNAPRKLHCDDIRHATTQTREATCRPYGNRVVPASTNAPCCETSFDREIGGTPNRAHTAP